ncbi:hypothetical protein CYG49_03030 [Candidatus Saccharibacteria bacterium]|nr:MAG: hypothetical protein CYG49_03030 [Candidatus Saccharibacteria bacterium]
MKKLLLEKIRLSQYFIFLLVIFGLLVAVVPEVTFNSGALTLFSVNSFLYGFYIAPILAAQRSRIEELHRIVRAEANAIFAMVLSVKKLPKGLRNEIQEMFLEYLRASIKQRRAGEGEKKYEQLISFCLDYKGEHQETIDKLLDKLVTNQQNRTNFTMQMNNRVFSNEWMIMLVLFSVTLSFVILLDASSGVIYQLLAAMLCTGLTMLLVILVKMSTLTHKKAKQMWDPYKKLVESHFHRID